MGQTKVIVGFDCNETFDLNEEEQVRSRTARLESILRWLVRHQLRLPWQQGGTPSFFPYNPAEQPRRLDYVATKGLEQEEEGCVLA